ncbi:hypothetical protein IG631_09289 [Alternaria alternata]|nr:hypothetical protein IG631_09289 [Alternaria alternata]
MAGNTCLTTNCTLGWQLQKAKATSSEHRLASDRHTEFPDSVMLPCLNIKTQSTVMNANIPQPNKSCSNIRHQPYGPWSGAPQFGGSVWASGQRNAKMGKRRYRPLGEMKLCVLVQLAAHCLHRET